MGVGGLGLVGNVISAVRGTALNTLDPGITQPLSPFPPIAHQIVLSRPQMRSSINCILIGLASFDSVVIVTCVLIFGLPAIADHRGPGDGLLTLYVDRVFYVSLPFLYPLGLTAQTGSAYLTLCVSLERYVAVCRPLQARSLCTYRWGHFNLA